MGDRESRGEEIIITTIAKEAGERFRANIPVGTEVLRRDGRRAGKTKSGRVYNDSGDHYVILDIGNGSVAICGMHNLMARK